jgi:deazaflavin-dependent oxidoreductase (nitroreductase family)
MLSLILPEGGVSMTITDPRTEESLRQGFKQFNRFMLLMWRLGLGPWVNAWPEVGGRILVITHTGRKTGVRRRTPVNYTIADGQIYCTAGFGGVSDWYRNIVANPQVEVWLPDGWWAGLAEEVTDAQTRIPLLRQVLIDSGFAARAAGIDPVGMTNAELDAATESYRLIHIRRTEARTGPGGPGELSWVWPLATMMLLPLALLRRRR